MIEDRIRDVMRITVIAAIIASTARLQFSGGLNAHQETG
jgi:hypothetical protein